MTKTNVNCAYCETIVEKPTSEVIRSNKIGRSMYCSLSCGAKHAAQMRDTKSKNVAEYNVAPKLCKGCGTPISYDKRINDYCTQSCAAKLNNVLFPKRTRTAEIHKRTLIESNSIPNCLPQTKISRPIRIRSFSACKMCGKSTLTKFCCPKCCTDFIKKQTNERFLSGGHVGTFQMRRYLIETRGAKCELCGWDKVNPKTGNVPIEMEHADGNHENNKLENLKLLCPNCHSLTPTYKNLNKGNGRSSRLARYHAGKSY